jgi:hypothetical protein
LFLFLAESLNLRLGPGFNFFASDNFFINTITEHAHYLCRMSSNLRSIAYDLHYFPDSKNYRRQNKMTFSPELYIVALNSEITKIILIFYTQWKTIHSRRNEKKNANQQRNRWWV